MTYNVNEAKTQLSSLLEAVQRGEEVTIARYGKPIAKLVALETPQKRELGFHPVAMTENLLEPTDAEVIDWFYRA